jgi:hypothetical protein
VPLFRRLRPVPLERPSLEELALPDQAPLKKRRADVLRVTSDALDRAGTLMLTPELNKFTEAFTAMLSSLTTGPSGGVVAPSESHLRQVTAAVKLGAAFADGVNPVRAWHVDPVTACAKDFAAYRHTHSDPKDLGIMGYFSAQCGFYLPLAGDTTQDVLPSLDLIVDVANHATTFDAATAAVDAVWESLAGVE